MTIGSHHSATEPAVHAAPHLGSSLSSEGISKMKSSLETCMQTKHLPGSAGPWGASTLLAAADSAGECLGCRPRQTVQQLYYSQQTAFALMLVMGPAEVPVLMTAP